MQVIVAQVSSQSVDMLVANQDAMLKYCYQGLFCDLTQILTEAQQQIWKHYYIYIDKAVIDGVPDVDELYQGIPEYPDPTKPEDMQQPIPVAILLPKNSQIPNQFYSYTSEPIAVGIIFNSKNVPNALTFLDYLYG